MKPATEGLSRGKMAKQQPNKDIKSDISRLTSVSFLSKSNACDMRHHLLSSFINNLAHLTNIVKINFRSYILTPNSVPS